MSRTLNTFARCEPSVTRFAMQPVDFLLNVESRKNFLQLAEWVNEPSTRTTLQIFYPRLWEKIENSLVRGNKIPSRWQAPLAKIYARIHGRATPLGIFSGLAFSYGGAHDETTNLSESDFYIYNRIQNEKVSWACDLQFTQIEKQHIAHQVLYPKVGTVKHFIRWSSSGILKEIINKCNSPQTKKDIARILGLEAYPAEVKQLIENFVSEGLLRTRSKSNLRLFKGDIQNIQKQFIPWRTYGKSVTPKNKEIYLHVPKKEIHTLLPGDESKVRAAASALMSIGWNRISSPMTSGIQSIKDSFHARYDTHSVPLLRLLSYLEDFNLDVTTPLPVDPLVSFFSKRLVELENQDITEWKLSELDILTIEKLNHVDSEKKNKLFGFSALVVLGDVTSEESTSRIWLSSLVGGGNARLAARFFPYAHNAQNINEKDFYPTLADDLIWAEVEASPRDFLKPLCRRPAITKYFIAVDTPIKKEEKAIALEDISVSLENNRFVLRSNKLKKIILPVIGNSLNMAADARLPVHFLKLVALEEQFEHLVFSWGPAGYRRFLPRVTYQGVMLCPAQWILTAEKLKNILGKKYKSDFAQKLKKVFSIPVPIEELMLLEDDRYLPFRIESEEGWLILVDAIEKSHRGFVSVYEVPSAITQPLLKRSGKGFVTETILSFKNTGYHPPRFLPLLSPQKHIPDSKWIYLKVFAPPLAQNLLLQKIKKMLENSSACKSWFYLRFHEDEKFSIRIRVQAKTSVGRNQILSAFEKLLHSQKLKPLHNGFSFEAYLPEAGIFGNRVQLSRLHQLWNLESNVCLSFFERKFVDDAWTQEKFRVILLLILQCRIFLNQEFIKSPRSLLKGTELPSEYTEAKNEVRKLLLEGSNSFDLPSSAKELFFQYKKVLRGYAGESRFEIYRRIVHLFLNRLALSNLNGFEEKFFRDIEFLADTFASALKNSSRSKT